MSGSSSSYPSFTHPINIHLDYCQIQSLVVPPLEPITYLLKTGSNSYTYPSAFVQQPNCNYAYSLSALWSNGSSIDPSVVEMKLKEKEQEIVVTINAEGKQLESSQIMVITYTVDNPYQQYTNSEALIEVNLKYKLFKLDHSAPTFSNDIPK